MKRAYKIIGAAVVMALVGAAVVGVVALAQGTALPNVFWPFGGGRGGGWESAYSEQMYNAIASKLGVDRAKLDAAVQEARQEVIEQAVKDGKITQEQADWLLNPTEAMKAQIEQAVKDGKISQAQADWLLQGVEQGFVPNGPGFGGRGGRGFGGPHGFWGQAKPTPTPSQ